VAGDANFRPKVTERYRQWLTHKFSTWWDQFGSTGCVGCGRCIAWCPVGIDVREELIAIAPATAPAGPIPWPVSPGEGRAPAPLAAVEPARHVVTTVRATGQETIDTVTLELATSDEGLLAARPGQFVMVELPAFASPPISISRIRPDGLDLTIRSAGPATAALTGLTVGAEVALRGPLGRGWPIEAAYGRDVVIVAGGIGLAPLRPLVEAILADRPRFGAFHLFLGARTPRDRLFVEQMSAIAGRRDMEVAEIVDRAGPEWLGRVGIVTQLFDHADWNGSRVTAFMCGPERMMQATAKTLEGRGVAPAATWLTLERNMACGVGTCGHCQLGPFFVCRDGPVFSLAELGTAFGREGL
jgi:NAD(P)H-flavin reductase